ncbi:MAG TPA: hypothetical protein VFZ63_10660 [Jiangellaceae bacterium]
MFGSTNNKVQRIRRVGIITGAIGLAAAASMIAPQAFGTDAEAPARIEARSVDTAAANETEAPEAEVTYERGVALSGTGDLNGRHVFAEIYGNSLYGGQGTVMVEPPGGPELGGSVEFDAADLLDGDVEFDFALSRYTRGGPVATRSSAQLAGTWELSGPSVEIDETFSDAGYLIHVTGTNTPVSADVTVTVDGQPVVLQMHDAFAFDLTITKTPL